MPHSHVTRRYNRDVGTVNGVDNAACILPLVIQRSMYLPALLTIILDGLDYAGLGLLPLGQEDGLREGVYRCRQARQTPFEALLQLVCEGARRRAVLSTRGT